MKQVIAMHGWCSDSSYWNIWEEKFKSNGWFWESAERGYANRQISKPTWKENDDRQFPNQKVVICHSLGTHLIEKEVIAKATHIVFINSFSRFIPIGKESRYLKIGLQGMQRKLGTNEEKKMMALFWKKASSPHDFKKINPALLNQAPSQQGLQKLQTDLDLLIKTQKLPNEIKGKAKVLVIDGEKDEIVLSQAKNELLEELSQTVETKPEHWIVKNEGHVILLPKIIKDTRLWLELNA